MKKVKSKAFLSMLLSVLIFVHCFAFVYAESHDYYEYYEDFESPNFNQSEIGYWSMSNFAYKLSGTNHYLQFSSYGGKWSTIIYNRRIFKNNFEYSVKISKMSAGTGQNVYVLFNYQDSKNYYYLKMDKSTAPIEPTTLNKVVDGITTVLATKDSAADFTGTGVVPKIVYNAGNITVYIGSSLYFENIHDDTFTSGKIGLLYNNTGGWCDEFRVKGECEDQYFGITETSSQNGITEVPTTPSFSFNFNIPFVASTVVPTSVKVSDGESYLAASYYNLAISNDDKTITVNFIKKLDNKKTYTIEMNSDIKSVDFGTGIPTTYQFKFTTIPPAVDVDVNQNSIEAGKTVYDYLGGTVTYGYSIKNYSLNENVDCAITAAVINPDGKAVYLKTFTGNIAIGESCFAADEFTVPAETKAGAELQFFNWKTYAGMQKLFPTNSLNLSKTVPEQNLVKYDVDMNSEVIKIYGNLPDKTAGQDVTFMMFNPTFDVASVSQSNALQNVQETLSDSSGYFEFLVPINQIQDFDSNDYKVYVNSDSLSVPAEATVFFASKRDRAEAIALINSCTNVDEMKTLIINHAKTLGYDFDGYKTLQNIDGLAQILVDYVAANKFDESDSGIIQKWIKSAILLENLNQGITSLMFGSNNILNYQDILQLYSLDNAPYNLKVYDIYNNKLNSAGIANVKSNLINKNFKSLDDMYLAFAKSVVVEALRNYYGGGYAHVNNVLTVNGVYAGLNLSAYSKKTNTSAIDSALVKATQNNTIAMVQNTIDTNINADIPSKTGGSNGPTAGSSGGSSYHTGGINVTTDTSGIIPEIEKVVKPFEFTDLNGYDWASEPVKALIEKEVISKSDDGLFRPAENITRAEFVKLVVQAKKINVPDDIEFDTFKDIPADDWSAKYIYAAFKDGFITGVSDTIFGKNEPITRQDAAVILQRAYNLTAAENANGVKFKDGDSIAEYATNAVEILASNGLINGIGDDMFSPASNCNRAEAAKIIYNVIKGEEKQ